MPDETLDQFAAGARQILQATEAPQPPPVAQPVKPTGPVIAFVPFTHAPPNSVQFRMVPSHDDFHDAALTIDAGRGALHTHARFTLNFRSSDIRKLFQQVKSKTGDHPMALGHDGISEENTYFLRLYHNEALDAGTVELTRHRKAGRSKRTMTDYLIQHATVENFTRLYDMVMRETEAEKIAKEQKLHAIEAATERLQSANVAWTREIDSLYPPPRDPTRHSVINDPVCIGCFKSVLGVMANFDTAKRLWWDKLGPHYYTDARAVYGTEACLWTPPDEAWVVKYHKSELEIDCRKRPSEADLDKLIYIIGWWTLRTQTYRLQGMWRRMDLTNTGELMRKDV